MTFSNVVQYAAAICFKANKCDISAATAEFSDLCHRAGYELPQNPWEFVKKWGNKLQSDGTIASGAALSGCKRKLTGDDVWVCYIEALDWFLRGRPGPYESAQQLMETNEVVRGIVEQSGVSARTLTRRLCEVDPKFHYGKYIGKPFLDDMHRDLRLAGVAENRPIIESNTRGLVVWSDEKVLCMNKDNGMGWFSSAHEDYGYKLPAVRHNSQVVKLKYIIAVNYIIGPVWIKFFTGTVGMPADRDGKSYRVSEVSP
jgi:hypothetical protein